MQLDRFALYQHRFECLDTQAVQGWRAVEQYWMLTDDFFENIPNLRLFHFHQFLGLLDGGRQAPQFQFAVDEWPEEFQRHFLRQPALMQFQRRAHHDHRTTRIVHPLTQQVLAKTPLLTLDHVGKRFQLSAIRAGDRFTASAVIQKCVYRFLQHALLVTDNNVWRI